MTNLLALPGGTELVGDYKIKRVLGAGGFGITYLADEIALAREVTIKEYFPTDYAARKDERQASPRSKDCAADYKWGLERFITEAQTLARFDHPNIVRVFRYFRANNTGYMVLKFEEGQSLKAWLKSLKRAVRQAELDAIIPPLLDALDLIHKGDFLHRDIAPDNIMIRKDRTPVLIDFGSARGEIASHSRTVSALVKPGYSPYEQYASTTSQQGPWTDIYSLGATLYHAVTGKRPPDAPSRMLSDEYVPAKNAALSSYRPQFLAAIDKALSIEIKDRPQSVAAWRAMLITPEAKLEPKAEKAGIVAGLGLKRGNMTAKAAAAAPIVVAGAPAATPPPPDAAPSKGQLLDFIDALRKTPEPVAKRAAPKTARAEPAPVAADPAAHYGLGYAGAQAGPVSPERDVRPATRKATRKAKPRSPEPAAAPPRRQTEHLLVPEERNKPIGRSRNWLFFLRSPWRGYAFKLCVGLAVASLAVMFQGEVPRPSGSSATTTASLSAERTVTAPTAQLAGHKGPVQRVGFIRSGRTMVSIGNDGTLRLWDTETGQHQRTVALDQSVPASASIDDRTAMTVSGSGVINGFDLERSEKFASVTPGLPITALSSTADQSIQAVALKGMSLALIDQKAPTKPVAMAEGHEGEIRAILPLLSRSAIASAGTDKMVRLWSADSLAPIRTYRGHTAAVTALSATFDSRSFASASVDGQVRIWSTASTRLIRVFSAHPGAIAAIAYAPSSDLLASAGADGQIRVWDTRRRKLIMLIEAGRQSPLRSIGFSPDGARLLSGHDDGTLRLWDTAALKVARDDR